MWWIFCGHLLAVLLREFTDHRLRIGLLSVCLLVCFTPTHFYCLLSSLRRAFPKTIRTACRLPSPVCFGRLSLQYPGYLSALYPPFTRLCRSATAQKNSWRRRRAITPCTTTCRKPASGWNTHCPHGESKQREVELALLTERNRMTRDMRRPGSYPLSRSILQIGALETLAHEPAKSRLGPIRRSLEDAINELRANLHNLKKKTSTSGRKVKAPCRIHHCRTALTYDPNALSLDASCSILAILQEALSISSNIPTRTLYRSNAANQRPRVYHHRRQRHPHRNPKLRHRAGFHRERARSMGGRTEFTTQNGFAVRVFIPGRPFMRLLVIDDDP